MMMMTDGAALVLSASRPLQYGRGEAAQLGDVHQEASLEHQVPGQDTAVVELAAHGAGLQLRFDGGVQVGDAGLEPFHILQRAAMLDILLDR